MSGYFTKVSDVILEAMLKHLQNAMQYRLVLYVMQQSRHDDEKKIVVDGARYSWINEKKLLNAVHGSRRAVYEAKRRLADLSILEVVCRGRKRGYRVNPRVEEWGKDRRELNVRRLVDGACVDGMNFRDGMDGVLGAFYPKVFGIEPEGVEIGVSELVNWPKPGMGPGRLAGYIEERTGEWPDGFDFLNFLRFFQKRIDSNFIHPDDIKATVDQINRLADVLGDDRNQYWAYCQSALEKKFNHRSKLIDEEVHSFRKEHSHGL